MDIGNPSITPDRRPAAARPHGSGATAVSQEQLRDRAGVPADRSTRPTRRSVAAEPFEPGAAAPIKEN